MQDSEIVCASLRNADEKVKDTKAARVQKKEPLMFLAATSMVYGALTKGKLSDKATNALKAAGAMAAVYAFNKPVEDVVGKIFNKKENEEKHPIVQSVVATAALIGTSALAIAGAKKGADKLIQKFKPSAENFQKVANSVVEKVDRSRLGKFTEKAANNFRLFELTNPKIAKATKASAVLAPITGTLILHDTLDKKIEKDRNEIANANINKLFLCRELAKSKNNQ